MASKERNKKHNKKENGHSRNYIKANLVCAFCTGGKTPNYKDWETLSHFLSDRGKILGRGRSGVCAKHQRRLTQAIKRARHLALLPFVISPQ
ncbi:MAG: 30S ribosomal protein S18 [Candidatus Blackburnbacteria bacterium]|nr:30S ribosomal protein S18 [Candidatus Blackburnbacteria bacterium]